MAFTSFNRIAYWHPGTQTRRARDALSCCAVHTPNLWPPKLPHLNPVDYCVWGIVQQREYQTLTSSVTYEAESEIADRAWAAPDSTPAAAVQQ